MTTTCHSADMHAVLAWRDAAATIGVRPALRSGMHEGPCAAMRTPFPHTLVSRLEPA